MIKLPNELTIAQVDSYKSQILPQIDDLDVITIDDGDLARIDTIGVQFMIAVLTYITDQGKQIQWKSNSSVLKESVTQLGINEAIFLQYIAE